MVRLYRSPISVGRRGVFTCSKLFLPAFVALRARESWGRGQHPVVITPFFLRKNLVFTSVIVRLYTIVYLIKSKREQNKEALKYILKLNLAEEGAMHCHWQCWQRMLGNYPKLSHGSCYHHGCQKLATTNFC
jgi:hypothetical protein